VAFECIRLDDWPQTKQAGNKFRVASGERRKVLDGRSKEDLKIDAGRTRRVLVVLVVLVVDGKVSAGDRRYRERERERECGCGCVC
jgi:hypothetical protein